MQFAVNSTGRENSTANPTDTQHQNEIIEFDLIPMLNLITTQNGKSIFPIVHCFQFPF